MNQQNIYHFHFETLIEQMEQQRKNIYQNLPSISI